MLSILAHALLAAGGYSCALALMKGYQRLLPLVVGVALIGLGFGVLPDHHTEAPDAQHQQH
jgi:predicted branched-subunit amino acid permease